MAPQKRRSSSGPDDDTDNSGDDQESNSTPSSSRKRRRINDESESNGSNSDSEVETSTPPSDLDVDDENEDEEEEELAATQAIRARHTQDTSQGNGAAESGILESVEVRNFMCHHQIEYTLGPLINFICGKNGSGKSAILTAIVLCLGGKAAATNRGSSLKKFIKEGTDSATITCRLKNQGEFAFRPDDYGETIQIERHFTRAGTSGFKIKNARGRVLSTKRADLDDICDHFNLQIENPLNVLSQDQARQFINSSSASEKYKLFVKGVLLEQLDQDYRLIQEQLENINPKIAAKKPDITSLEKQHQAAQNKLNLSRRHDGMLEKLRDYRRQLAWAQIQDQEAILADYVKEVASADTKIEEAEAEVANLDATYQNSDRLSGEATMTFGVAQAEVDKVKEEKVEEKGRQDEAKKDTSEAQAEQRAIRSELEAAKQTIDTKNNEIEREKERLAEIDGGGAARRQDALKIAEEAVTRAQAEYEDHSSLRSSLVDNIKTANAAEASASENVRQKKDEVEQQNARLTEIKRRLGGHDNTFHPKMTQLLKLIQQETRFEHIPIGPVGKHVKLLRPEWSSILEKYFGSTLNGFIVTSKRDQQLLSDLLQKLRMNVPITIGNNYPLDTRPNEPEENLNTILRSLEINNESVRKVLVIAHSIENTVLIADQQEASRVLFQSGGPPRNARRCLCFHATTKNKGYILHFRGNRPAQDPIDQYVGNARMQTNLEAQIQLQEAAVQEAKAQVLQAEQDHRIAQNAHVSAKQANVRHKRDEQDLRIAVQQAEAKVEDMKDEIGQDQIATGRLQELEGALKEAEAQKSLNENLFMDSQNNLDSKKRKLKEITVALGAFDERIAVLEQEANKAKAKAQQASKRRENDLHKKNAAIGRIDDAKQDRDSLERKRVAQEEQIAAWTEQARQVCERVNIDGGETYESLDKKYKRLMEDYKKSQNRLGGTREQIEEQAANAAEAFNQSKKDLAHLEEIEAKLTSTLLQRKERWKKFRNFISAHAKGSFTYLLSERSFRGRLVTDHKQKLLELRVEPDITRKDGSGQSTRGLSGGEKSFTQICLLLAVWEAMGSPIRCLDEFDVFMDAVNRTMTVNLLIEAARQSPGRQFIFISPGLQSDIPKAPDVLARDLEAPDRGQTQLSFVAARN